jgi:hypothetical protein
MLFIDDFDFTAEKVTAVLNTKDEMIRHRGDRKRMFMYAVFFKLMTV